jgi:hypothetical protein
VCFYCITALLHYCITGSTTLVVALTLPEEGVGPTGSRGEASLRCRNCHSKFSVVCGVIYDI